MAKPSLKKIAIEFRATTNTKNEELSDWLTSKLNGILKLGSWIGEFSSTTITISKAKEPYKSRTARLSDAAEKIRDGASTAEEIKDELESWRDNLPENFSDKASELDEAVSFIDEAVAGANEAADNLDNVEVPGAFGR